MTLIEMIEEVKKWSINRQIDFCNLITYNITIGIRSIMSYEDEKDLNKLEAIRWLNEFHHRVENLKFDIKKVVSSIDKVERIAESAKYYSRKNKITCGEIAAIIRSSYNSIIRQGEIKKPFKYKQSIFDLIVDEDFRKRTAMYLGEKKISILRGFIYGYFYGLDVKEIHLRESEPNFDKFNDWVVTYYNWYESTAGWENIILKECGGDEKLSVDKFFELYDEFKRNK